MAFLRKKVQSGAAVGKRVLLQVVLRSTFRSSKDLSYFCSTSSYGICLLAWMGWSVDIEGRGLGEPCTYDKMFSKKLSHIVKITMATNKCSRSKPSSQLDMEILKIHAPGISKHGEMDYEAVDESCITWVGSLTLNDDNPVTEDALAANFLIPLDEKLGGGGSLAELCCDCLEDFNPIVHVSVEKGIGRNIYDLLSFDVSFFKKFDVVVISCCSLAAKKSVNEKCRKQSNRVAFYIVDCRDSCGEIFVDLQKYSYAQPNPLFVLVLALGLHTAEEMVEDGFEAPEKVTATDLFYLRSMDQGTENVSYLLAQYLFRHAKGRRSGARMSGGHFIGRLADHFVLVSDEGLMGLFAPQPLPVAAQTKTMPPEDYEAQGGDPGWLSAISQWYLNDLQPSLSTAERVSQGTKPRAQPGHKKHSTSSKQPSVSSKEATKFLNPHLPGLLKFKSLPTKVLILQSQKHKQELEKNKVEVEAALLKAHPPSINGQLNDFWKCPPKSSSQPEGEHIKKDKGKMAMSLEEAEKESTNSGSNDDDETYVIGFMVKSSTTKKLKKFDFIIKDRKHVHLTEEQINQQEKIKEEAKAEAAKHEGEVRKEELVDLLGPEVVNKEDGTSEVIPNFKASDLHFGEWREVVKACPNKIGKGWKTIEHDSLDKLNDLANKKRKHVDDIHDYFKANKRLKSSVQYEDHLPGTRINEPVFGMIMFNSYHRQDFVTIEDLKVFSNTMLYTVQEIFFGPHQGPRQDDHARTFAPFCLLKLIRET
ncbi:pleiotropic drug resistance protein 1-like protein [Tanacetum coccineum]